jgi:hypothetical protein
LEGISQGRSIELDKGMHPPIHNHLTSCDVIQLDMPVGAIVESLARAQGVGVGGVVPYCPAFLDVSHSAGESDVDDVQLTSDCVDVSLVEGHG